MTDNIIGKKIRTYRSFRGWNQVQLAEKSGINVNSIRKYELGIRNPKPAQLERIADALGLNISVFLDFNVDTVGDVLSLLFAIDDSTDLVLVESTPIKGTPSNAVAFYFKNTFLQHAVENWCKYKETYKELQKEILKIEDDDLRHEKLEELENDYQEWKLRSMGTAFGCNTVVHKNDGITE